MTDIPNVAAPGSALTHVVHDTWERAAGLVGEWDSLYQRLGADIYLSPTAARVWWDHYGRGQLRIFEFRDGGRLVGVLPMFISTVWAGPVPVRIAKFLSADSTIVVLTPGVETSVARQVYGDVVQSLFRNDGVDLICFGPLSGEDGLGDDIAQACRDEGARIMKDRSRIPHTVYHLREGIDAYLSGLSKKRRHYIRSSVRALENRGQLAVEVIEPAEAAERFADFVAAHSRLWAEKGRLGHFGDWPGAEAYNMDLVTRLAQRGELCLIRITLDGSELSWEYAFLYGQRGFERLTARVLGDEWDKAGLGSVSLVKMFEVMQPLGVTHIESGPGHYDHKVMNGVTEYGLRSIVASRAGLGASLKCRALLLYAAVLHYAYFRGWFGRIAPKLGLGRRTLWKSWIRTRLY